jgi:hypothetical protein
VALGYQGGNAAKILLRAGVAAALNACAFPGPGGYPLTLQEVIDLVNQALATGDRQQIISLARILDGYNNGACSLSSFTSLPFRK